MSKQPPAPNRTTDPAQHAAQALVSRMRAGERRAIAEAVTELERLMPRTPHLLMAMQPWLGRAHVIGFTGPPGAGKSTLVNAVIGELRARGRSVGVIAIDPSSPISRGAILGDRIRMTAARDDDAVFVRSLASRGALGGLSPAAVRVIDALDAAGKDVILIETVGTGQSEIDIAEVADVRVVLTAPGLGDGIQAMKAGLIEIADILVVNKADREGADRSVAELKASQGVSSGATQSVPVLRTSALTGDGVPALVDAIEACSAGRDTNPLARRRRRARHLIARAAAELVLERIRAGGDASLDRLADAVLLGETSPLDAARTLIA